MGQLATQGRRNSSQLLYASRVFHSVIKWCMKMSSQSPPKSSLFTTEKPIFVYNDLKYTYPCRSCDKHGRHYGKRGSTVTAPNTVEQRKYEPGCLEVPQHRQTHLPVAAQLCSTVAQSLQYSITLR